MTRGWGTSIEQDYNLHKPIKRRVNPPTVIMRMERYAAAYFDVINCETSVREKLEEGQERCVRLRELSTYMTVVGYVFDVGSSGLCSNIGGRC